MTLWFTFVPCFLWIFAGAPYVETVRNVRWLATALAAVTAAVVGIIANLALWFALHVLFGAVGELAVGPVDAAGPRSLRRSILPRQSIALAAGVALIRFKVNLFAVLAAAMAAGVVLRGFDGKASEVSRTGSTPIPRSRCARSPRRSGRRSR